MLPTIPHVVGDTNDIGRVDRVTGTPMRLSSKPTYLTTQLAMHARRSVGGFDRRRGRSYPTGDGLDDEWVRRDRRSGRRVKSIAATWWRGNQLVALGGGARTVRRARRRYHLTAVGRRQLRRLDRELALAQERFLEPLGDDERADYVRLLAQLLEHHMAGRPSS